MRLRRLAILLIALLIAFGGFVAFPLSSLGSHGGHGGGFRQGDLGVRNLNTEKSYLTIQEAIDAPETLAGHEISVASGIYYEHVIVDKSLSLVGEDSSTTIIDGEGKGTVIYVTADNVEVKDFTLQSGTFGLWLDESQNSRIVGNTVRDGSYGIRLYDCRNVEVLRNDVQGYVWFGIELKSSSNCTLRENCMIDNEYNFGVNGDALSAFIHDIDVSNTVNGKPVQYLINQKDLTIDASTFLDMGYLGVVNSSNIDLRDLEVRDNVQGILLAFTRDGTIRGVTAEYNWNGIYVAHSANISVSANEASDNFDYGIKLFNSSHCAACHNNVDNNGWAGIGVFTSPYARIEDNEVSFATYDLHIVYTNNSVITRNRALIDPGASARYSIAMYYSHNNLIYHNTFTNSLLYVETRNGTGFTPTNRWDNGLEGNYWRSCKAVDVDHDGIGDTPYVVGENNVDAYPLMGSFAQFDVHWTTETYTVSVISNCTISQFQFSSDDGQISFAAIGENGTTGFSRIAVPTAFLGNLEGNLSVVVNGEPPILNRKWADGTHTYFHFSHLSEGPEGGIDPLLIVIVVTGLLAVLALVFLVLKR